MPITASRMGHLWAALNAAYDRLGFADAAGDEVLRQLVLARHVGQRQIPAYQPG